jgi:hypothetical protein
MHPPNQSRQRSVVVAFAGAFVDLHAGRLCAMLNDSVFYDTIDSWNNDITIPIATTTLECCNNNIAT